MTYWLVPRSGRSRVWCLWACRRALLSSCHSDSPTTSCCEPRPAHTPQSCLLVPPRCIWEWWVQKVTPPLTSPLSKYNENICMHYNYLLYLSWNIPIYKETYKNNTLDWYVIPRDKMKNATEGYAKKRTELITHVQFVWIKRLRYINYAVAYAQCLRQHV